MSPKTPRVNAVELLRALHRDGWLEKRQRGSHVQLEHPTKPGIVTVPNHTGKIIPPKVLASVLDQAGLNVDELRDLL